MRIEEAFEAYLSKVAEVHIYRQEIKHGADHEIQRLVKQRDNQRTAGFDDSFTVSAQNMSFRTAETGVHNFYSFHDSTIQQSIDSLIVRTNRQYQWLLVDTYELFEDYLEHAYACMGYSDKNFWPLRDFGNATLSELELKDYQYFLQQSQGKKDRPYSILNQFRHKIPYVKRFELTNKLDTNLSLAVALIEKLRHFIVHLRGVVHDKQKTIKEILERAGVYNNGKTSAAELSFIDSHLRLATENNSIFLLDIAGESIGPMRTHIDLFGSLTDHLLAYAFVIHNGLKSHAAD